MRFALLSAVGSDAKSRLRYLRVMGAAWRLQDRSRKLVPRPSSSIRRRCLVQSETSRQR